MVTVSVTLPTGTLSVRVRGDNAYALRDLCGFAARSNTKRGFLFLSKVLGKHWPSPVAAMADLHAYLAQGVDTALGRDVGDVLFIGMAETGTGLGHGVFETFLGLPGRRAAFVQTTRYPLAGAQVVAFEEAHSHATRQFLYVPDDAQLRTRVCAAETIVICDDEASTGRTFADLVGGLRVINPALRRVVLVLITDFSNGQAAQRVAEVPGIDRVDVVSALSGAYEFEWSADARLPGAAAAYGRVGCRRGWVSSYSGRLCLDRQIELPEATIDDCVASVGTLPVLVVGTGEFMHPAYRLASALAARCPGLAVFVQSTTRSPILVGADVRSALPVADPYGEGIPNFLYNYRREDYGQVLVVHETPSSGPVRQTVAEIGGHAGCIEVNLQTGTVRRTAGTRRSVEAV
jgi:hypothetical protein